MFALLSQITIFKNIFGKFVNIFSKTASLWLNTHSLDQGIKPIVHHEVQIFVLHSHMIVSISLV